MARGLGDLLLGLEGLERGLGDLLLAVLGLEGGLGDRLLDTGLILRGDCDRGFASLDGLRKDVS